MDYLKESDKNDIYIRHAITETPDNTGVDFHIHDRCEIFYFISGNAQYLVEGSVYPLEPGTLLIMRPGEAHCIRFMGSKRYERYAVNFPLSLFDGFDTERRLIKPYNDRPLGVRNLYFIDGLEDTFHELCYYEGDDYGRMLFMITGLADIMKTVIQHHTGKVPAETSMSTEIVRYVNDMIAEDITVEKLAKHFYLSTSQFSRIFKESTGASPWAYITAKRLISAREMLMNGSGAKKAAETCGFKDYSVFYKAYVKRFHESPGSSGKL